MKISVVMYHYVRDLSQSSFPNIKGLNTKEFLNQIDYFKKNYNFVTINDCISALNAGELNKLPTNSMLLTFDDGFIDHYDTVFPILVKNKIQGTFFPPAKPVLEHIVLDTHKIHFLLASNSNTNDLIQDIFKKLDSNRKEYKLNSNEYYFKKLAVPSRFDNKEVIFIKRLLQNELPEILRSKIIHELFTITVNSDEVYFSKKLYMSEQHLKEMISENMFIGGHGYDHYWLEKLNYSDQKNEIDLTIRFLKKIGAEYKDWVMCYPYGSYNNETLRILKANGCKLSFTTIPGISNFIESNKFELERFDTNDFLK